MPEMTGLELQTLTRLVCAIRPEWDEPGVRANIAKLALPLADATPRALGAAMNPAARSPGAIGWPLDNPTPADPLRPGRASACAHCGRDEWGCWRAQLNTGLDAHTYRPTGNAPERRHDG